MKKFSKIITGLTMALALLVGGLVTSAPAQAAAGSTVSWVNGCTSDGCNYPVRITNTSGSTFNMYQWEKAANVFRVCPWSIGQRLEIVGPNGGVKVHPYGACFAPGGRATYKLAQLG